MQDLVNELAKELEVLRAFCRNDRSMEQGARMMAVSDLNTALAAVKTIRSALAAAQRAIDTPPGPAYSDTLSVTYVDGVPQ